MSTTSKYKLYSIGVVAADKEDKSRVIEVYPFEKIPFFEGEISDDTVDITKEGVDASGQTYHVKLTKSMTVPAEWIGETNRWTAPNVKKGEQVKLYTVDTTDIYYWEPVGRDDHLRREELVIWGFAASKSGSDKDIQLTQDNCYVFIVDTKNGHVTMKTSKDNGEHCRYTLQADGKNGIFTAMDDLGNMVRINSKTTEILLINADNTLIRLSKKVLEVAAAEMIKADTEKLIVKTKRTEVTGDTLIDGQLDVTGLITSKEDVTSNGVSLVYHPHTGNLGSPTSMPIATLGQDMAIGG